MTVQKKNALASTLELCYPEREEKPAGEQEPKFTISNSITKALIEIERARGFLDAAELKEA